MGDDVDEEITLELQQNIEELHSKDDELEELILVLLKIDVLQDFNELNDVDNGLEVFCEDDVDVDIDEEDEKLQLLQYILHLAEGEELDEDSD